MISYAFRCPQCGTGFEQLFEHDEEKRPSCPACGANADRIYQFAGYRIDWVNGGYHGDEVNLGLGKHFKSALERENYAKSLGLVKIKDG